MRESICLKPRPHWTSNQSFKAGGSKRLVQFEVVNNVTLSKQGLMMVNDGSFSGYIMLTVIRDGWLWQKEWQRAVNSTWCRAIPCSTPQPLNMFNRVQPLNPWTCSTPKPLNMLVNQTCPTPKPQPWCRNLGSPAPWASTLRGLPAVIHQVISITHPPIIHLSTLPWALPNSINHY